MMTCDRRKIAGLLASGVALGLWSTEQVIGAMTQGQMVDKPIGQLQPGDFTWHPERSLDWPVAIVVSIPEQLVHVYCNGIQIAVSTCSTGKPGHSTPTGVVTILQKDKNHKS